MNISLFEFRNVFFDNVSKYEFHNLAESEALLKTFVFLSKIMKHRFEDYVFYIFASYDQNIEPTSLFLKSNKKKVLVFISEESGTLPNNISQSYHAVFKSYLKKEPSVFSNIFNFPLCCVKNVPISPVLPMYDRTHSVFFIGYLNHNRINFYLSLLSSSIIKIPKFSVRLTIIRRILTSFKSSFDTRFLNAYIRFTKGFRQGVSPTEYGRLITNSKIVLCPSGIASSECYRHYEAMRSGCVIISEKLPLTYFYRNSPIIQVDNWQEGLHKAAKLLDNPIEMDRLGNLTQKWWIEKCSEEATAEFIFKKLTYLNI